MKYFCFLLFVMAVIQICSVLNAVAFPIAAESPEVIAQTEDLKPWFKLIEERFRKQPGFAAVDRTCKVESISFRCQLEKDGHLSIIKYMRDSALFGWDKKSGSLNYKPSSISPQTVKRAENMIRNLSPLPLPPNKLVYERKLVISFVPRSRIMLGQDVSNPKVDIYLREPVDKFVGDWLP